MSKIDLNIIDRGTTGTDWVAENTGISAESLSKVVEQKTDNAGALNSLPTPSHGFTSLRRPFGVWLTKSETLKMRLATHTD